MNLEKYVRKGESIGLSEIEIAVFKATAVSVNVERGEVQTAETSTIEHLIVRGLMNKRLGVYVSDRVNEEELDNAISKVCEIARNSSPDDKWDSLPEPESYGNPVEWDREIEKTGPDYYVNLMSKALSMLSERDKRALLAYGSSGCSYGYFELANSRGVHAEDSTGYSYIHVGVIGTGGEVSTPLILGLSFSRKVDPGVEKAVSEALDQLKNAYKSAEGKTEKAIVVMDPRPLEDLLSYTLLPAITGENVVRGRSPLINKLGKAVASQKLTMVEDPFLKEGARSSRTDGEGVPTRRKTIVEKGILRTFIWDNYWAKVKGLKSTGNGFRDWGTGGIRTQPTNLVIQEGRRVVEEIISEIRHGYYVTGVQGAHSSNPDTGDFSVVANPAFLIEDGEIKGLVQGVMLGGNIYELLTNLVEVAKGPKPGSVLISPALVFENVAVASKA
ncbi:MAG: TldD/PmbA family protein [Thermoprotei archaeon]|nr:MAG: TldD/PmbA family protein [Thermoprotei archaeon]HDI31688.1 TldD/PmbA family protein [Thermofilum sp.]